MEAGKERRRKDRGGTGPGETAGEWEWVPKCVKAKRHGETQTQVTQVSFLRELVLEKTCVFPTPLSY